MQSAVLFWLRVYLCSSVLLYFLWKKCFLLSRNWLRLTLGFPPSSGITDYTDGGYVFSTACERSAERVRYHRVEHAKINSITSSNHESSCSFTVKKRFPFPSTTWRKSGVVRKAGRSFSSDWRYQIYKINTFQYLSKPFATAFITCSTVEFFFFFTLPFHKTFPSRTSSSKFSILFFHSTVLIQGKPLLKMISNLGRFRYFDIFICFISLHELWEMSSDQWFTLFFKNIGIW